jgi:hypothetical protein
MRNHHKERNAHWMTVYDSNAEAFLHRPVLHPFLQQLDPLDEQLAKDCGLDVQSLLRGELKLAAE